MKMKNIVLSVGLLSAFATPAVAQETSATSSEEPRESSEIIVVGDAFSETDGLLARQSSTGSRFPVDVERLPNTIRILPQELIQDTAATLPQDVTKYVSGVQTLPGFGDNAGFLIRGFFANYEILRNGVRGENPADLSNIERIEVLKGPISSLYGGTGAFAGNINVITKRPLREFGGEVTLFGGSKDFYRLQGDVGGPLNTDGSLRFRLTGAAESADSFREFVSSEKYIGSGSIEYAPSDALSLRIDTSYLRRNYSFDEGLPLLDGSLASGMTTFDLPIGRTVIDPGAGRARETYWNIGGEANVELAAGLTFRVAGLYTDYSINIGSSRVSGSVQPDGRTVDRITFEGPQSTWRYTVQSDLIYRTNAIGRETVFLAGYERFKNRYDYDASSRALGPLDLITGVRTPPPVGGLAPAFAGFSSYRGDAVYGQIFSQLTDKLSVLAGLRQDWQRNDGQFNGQGLPISGSQLSPRFGATYYLTDNTILFGNWAKSFAPNFAFDIDGDVFESDQIRQLEVGIRQKLFDDRALLTVAGFDIKRFNVVIPDINNFGQSIAAGRQSSKGVEVDLTGKLAPGLEMIATYAYVKTRAEEPNDPNFGQQLAAAPKHSAALFIRYAFEDGPVKGLSLNGGLTWNSDIQASFPNSIVIPDNARLDLGAAYTIADRWRLGVNVTSVTNSRTYVTNLFALYPQAPRQFVVTLSRSFGANQ
jgi:iron complex outermembrane recepter protein